MLRLSLRQWRDSLAWLRNPYAVLDHKLARGETSFWLQLLGIGEVLVTGEPALITEAVRNPLLIGGRGTRALQPVIGTHAMISSEGEQHRTHRALVAPFFTAATAARYEQHIVHETQHVLAAIPIGTRLRALALFHDIHLSCIVSVVFGALEAPQKQQLVDELQRYVGSLRQPWWLFVRGLQQPWLPTWHRFQVSRSRLRASIEQHLRRSGSDHRIESLADRIGAAQWPPAQAVDAVLEILLFGHDTAAAALAWWLGWLCAHPADYERAQAEARHAAESDFLEATIQESLRLSPVVVHATRVAVSSTRIGAFDLRQGAQLFLCAYLAQRHPALWQAPGSYLPERFMHGKPRWSAHFPFGLGERLCVGMGFALYQMRIVAREVLRAARFALEPDYALVPQRQLVLMVPGAGLPITRVG